MVIDHVGAAFFPGVMIWRIIGRIAFPIFAYCLVVGCLYTRDIKKYLLRLLVFAVISQPVYLLNWYGIYSLQQWLQLNIVFTLFFGAIAVYGLMDLRRRWWMLLPVVAAFMWLKLEYGWYGLALIVAFYVFRKHRWLSLAVITAILAVKLFEAPFVSVGDARLGAQGLAILALPFIYIQTNLKLRVNKYFYYAFYPAHLALIYTFKYVLK